MSAPPPQRGTRTAAESPSRVPGTTGASAAHGTEPCASELEIRSFEVADAERVVAIWRRCGLVVPQNNPYKDIARKLKVRPDLFLVGLLGGRIVAAVMAGYEGHRGCVNYLAVEPALQGRGFGRRMMIEAERLLRLEGCAKVNLNVRTSNPAVIAFYRSIGYAIDDVVCMSRRLEFDQPS